jgi:hypothetical protein
MGKEQIQVPFSQLFCSGITKLVLSDVSMGKASFAIPSEPHYASENTNFMLPSIIRFIPNSL